MGKISTVHEVAMSSFSMCTHYYNNHLPHGQRTPDEAFFHRNPELLRLGRYILGHLGYFRPIYQHPFCYCESLVHVFHQSTIIKPLYPNPKHLFGMGI